MIHTIKRIQPDSPEGRRLAIELGAKWSPRARTEPIDHAAVDEARFGWCRKGKHVQKLNWGARVMGLQLRR